MESLEGRISYLEKGQEDGEKNITALWKKVNEHNDIIKEWMGGMKTIKMTGGVVIVLNAIILLLTSFQMWPK